MVHGVQHLYHDPVAQTGEIYCAIDMEEYENKRIKKIVCKNSGSIVIL